MDPKNTVKRNNQIKSIVKAAEIIDLLMHSDRPMSLTEMSKQLKMAKSTLHGIASTLVSLDYISQDADGKYSLGMKLLDIGSSVSMRLEERRVARSYMEDLAIKTGETVHLAVLRDGEVLYIDKQESPNSIRIVTEAGLKLPAHCTGVGKALLSGLNDNEIEELYEQRGLDKYTETTITDIGRLKGEVAMVREQGFATDQQEFMVGLRCVAIPIYDRYGNVTCAISISGPLARMSGDIFQSKRKELMKIAKKISRDLGYEI